jgi:hypothetical protein
MSKSKLAETFEALSAAFEALPVRWYVFGAKAAILHGITRATADIDVTVDAGDRPTHAVADSLAGHGFTLRVADPAFVEQTRVLPVVHAVGVPVDVVLAGPGRSSSSTAWYTAASGASRSPSRQRKTSLS